MKILRILLLCALYIPIASAQTKFIGSYPAAGPLQGGELMPVVQGGALLESSPSAMLTYMYQFFTATFANMASGTNTTATMVCSTGCSIAPGGTGTVSANQVNGVAIPSSAGIVQTNAAGVIVQANGSQFTPLTWAAINAITCTSSNNGAEYWITDSNNTTFGGNITGSSAGHAVFAVCNGTNWTVH